ncbi:exported hypothetical protein [Magnetospirillum sp. UT-4]|nr:exported hypothetical protein [Magnetospirillum sp. UT-4]
MGRWPKRRLTMSMFFKQILVAIGPGAVNAMLGFLAFG